MSTLKDIERRLQKIEQELNPPCGILVVFGNDQPPQDCGRYAAVVRFPRDFEGVL